MEQPISVNLFFIFLQTQPALSILKLGRSRDITDASWRFWCTPWMYSSSSGFARRAWGWPWVLGWCRSFRYYMFKNGFLFVCVCDVCTKFLKLQVLRLLRGANSPVKQCEIVLKVENAVRKSAYLPVLTIFEPISLTLSGAEGRSFSHSLAKAH